VTAPVIYALLEDDPFFEANEQEIDHCVQAITNSVRMDGSLLLSAPNCPEFIFGHIIGMIDVLYSQWYILLTYLSRDEFGQTVKIEKRSTCLDGHGADASPLLLTRVRTFVS
jgi:hypothetical protein